jgi:hypothetical protein
VDEVIDVSGDTSSESEDNDHDDSDDEVALQTRSQLRAMQLKHNVTKI